MHVHTLTNNEGSDRFHFQNELSPAKVCVHFWDTLYFLNLSSYFCSPLSQPALGPHLHAGLCTCSVASFLTPLHPADVLPEASVQYCVSGAGVFPAEQQPPLLCTSHPEGCTNSLLSLRPRVSNARVYVEPETLHSPDFQEELLLVQGPHTEHLCPRVGGGTRRAQ